MISEEQLLLNKEKFIELIKSINRDGANIEGLINKLENSDFFTTAASTKYHCDYRGGLCEHSLNVYNNLVALNNCFNLNTDENTLKIIGLLHDFSKMNIYKEDFRNKKVYSPNGSKKDEGGNFDWVTQKGFVKKETLECFFFGNHEETAEFMIRSFIPLSIEESMAVMYHHGGIGWDSTSAETATKVFSKYSLALYLHLADLKAAMYDEMNNE